MRDLGVTKDDDNDGQQEEEKDGQHPSHEKFPQRVKNKILSHVKSPPQQPSSTNDGDDRAPAPPQRRRRDKLRDKLRLSIKHEE